MADAPGCRAVAAILVPDETDAAAADDAVEGVEAAEAAEAAVGVVAAVAADVLVVGRDVDDDEEELD